MNGQERILERERRIFGTSHSLLRRRENFFVRFSLGPAEGIQKRDKSFSLAVLQVWSLREKNLLRCKHSLRSAKKSVRKKSLDSFEYTRIEGQDGSHLSPPSPQIIELCAKSDFF